tara:strand:- start:978 stop:1430 length:453 start_codon:yes stop_codon:yes gene_type:complete
MAGYVNKVIIIGNLGKDPELKSFDNGGKIANFSVATTESWKDKATGEKKEKTEWHNVTVRQNGNSKIIDAFIEPYLKKGNKVYIEGKLETRSWEQEGTKRYTTEVIVSGPSSTVELLERPPSNNTTESAMQGSSGSADTSNDLDTAPTWG